MAVNITSTPKLLTDTQLDAVLRPIYYARGGFQGVTGLHSKLPKGSASKKRVRRWIAAQSVGRYTQTKPPRTVYAHFAETTPNRVHQADLLFMPNDKGYRYALNVVDIASRYKVSVPLKTKYAAGVAKELALMYKNGPLRFPKKLMVDDGGEFKREVSTLMRNRGVEIRRAEPGHHRSQAFVESFNRWIAQRLFRGQYEKELATNKDNREWVSVLQTVVADINTTITRLTGIAPADAIKMPQVPLAG
jgi:transposase InsO family protein